MKNPFWFFQKEYSAKQYTGLYCSIMNLLDFRYWNCECWLSYEILIPRKGQLKCYCPKGIRKTSMQ